MTSYLSSSSEEERAVSPPPPAGRVPSGTPNVYRPAPAGDRSTRSSPSGLQLRSSAPADRSRLGFNGLLSPPPAGRADVDHSSAVDSLYLDWISSGLSWPSCGPSVAWRSGQVSLCSMQSFSCINLWV